MQNHQDGTASFSRYDAHAFFGAGALICDLEIARHPVGAHPDESIELLLAIRSPWRGSVAVDTIVGSTDLGELLVDPSDPGSQASRSPSPAKHTLPARCRMATCASRKSWWRHPTTRDDASRSRLMDRGIGRSLVESPIEFCAETALRQHRRELAIRAQFLYRQ